MTEMTVEQYREWIKTGGKSGLPSKYRAIRCEYKGQCFDSKAERDFYAVLELMRANGPVRFF